MSQPSGNIKTPNAQQLKLIAKKPRKIIAAIRSWGEASGIVASDPLDLGAAPLWVARAWAEVAKVYMPSKRMFANGELDLELLGELIGRLWAYEKLLAGEIPMESEMKAEVERIKKQEASPLHLPERAAQEKRQVQAFQATMEPTNQAIPNLISAVMHSSHEDTVKFQKGLLRGMNLSADQLIAERIYQRHTRTFLVLALYWRTFSKCRSLGEIYKILCKAVGESRIGSWKTFQERVARKIGLKVRGRGHPPNE